MTGRVRAFTPTDEFRPVPFKVVCGDAWSDEFGGPLVTITIDAIGPRDAMNQVRTEYPDLRPLRAVRA